MVFWNFRSEISPILWISTCPTCTEGDNVNSFRGEGGGAVARPRGRLLVSILLSGGRSGGLTKDREMFPSFSRGSCSDYFASFTRQVSRLEELQMVAGTHNCSADYYIGNGIFPPKPCHTYSDQRVFPG